jgi:hypothetical protein
MPFPRRALPRMAKVRQLLPSGHISDAREEIREKLLATGLARAVRPGAKIAITAGSRGIGGFVALVRGIVDAVKSCGGEPFIIPAMGSHGGATPSGQEEILRRLGITADAVDAPVRATMDTVALDAAANGAVAHVDRLAYDADGVIVLGRVKTHPDSAGELASGLLKMSTIGLGKQAGAQQAHNHGLWDSVRQVPEIQLSRARILCGVAVVENGYREPLAVEVAPPDYRAFLETDIRLLNLAKAHLAVLPFESLDLLVVDELGKTVSGAGMDPNIIGRWRHLDAPHLPDYRRIAVLSLTEASLGNGLGIGMADTTTERFAAAFDPRVTYVNLLTAIGPGGNTREGLLPLALPSDREAAEVALYSALAGAAPRVCRIKNTGALDEMWVSEGLIDEVKSNPKLTIMSELGDPPYDSAGNLLHG